MLKRIVLALVLLATPSLFGTTFSKVAVTGMASNGVTITFTTSTAVSGQVFWGVSNLGNGTVPDTSGTSHSFTITGLQTGVVYQYQASASDSTTSAIQKFQLCDSGANVATLQGRSNTYYAYGTYSVTWSETNGTGQSPTICGAALTQSYSGALDYLGSLNLNIPSNLKIVPSPSTWTIAISDIGSISTQSISSTVAEPSSNITSSLATAVSGKLQAVLYNPATTTFFPTIQASPCVTTAGSLQYNNAGSFGCVTPFTFSGSTITAAAGGLFDMSAATGVTALKVPVGAGYAPTVNGAIGYDSTANLFVTGINGATGKQAYFTGANPVSGNCTKWGANGVLQDNGAACGGGANPAGTGSEINARLNATTFQAVTGSSTASGNITLQSNSSFIGSAFQPVGLCFPGFAVVYTSTTVLTFNGECSASHAAQRYFGIKSYTFSSTFAPTISAGNQTGSEYFYIRQSDGAFVCGDNGNITTTCPGGVVLHTISAFPTDGSIGIASCTANSVAGQWDNNGCTMFNVQQENKAVKSGSGIIATQNSDGSTSLATDSTLVGPLNQITAANGAQAGIANGNNPITWNWAQTTDAQDAMAFGETAAATGGTLTNGLANQALHSLTTLSGSTSTPLEIVQGGVTGTVAFPALQVETMWNNAGLTGEGIIENVTNTSSAAGSLLADLRVGNTSQWKVDKAGNTTQLGSATLNGATSGALVIIPQSVAGTPTWTAGTSSGTPAVTASAPLGITAATGNATCATCTTNAAALTNNAVVLGGGGQATQTVAGIVSDGTSKLTLGVAGTSVGAVLFNNATSGTITVQPVTGALGTVTQSLPAASGTFAVSATAPITESATGAVGCATCATTAAGGTLTLDQVGSPAANTAFIVPNANTVIFNDSAASSTNNIFQWTDATSNTGTGNLATFTLGQASNLARGVAITSAGTGLTIASKLLDLSATWNAAVNFETLFANMTNTSSGSSANLIHMQVGAADKFIVDKNGGTSIAGNLSQTASSAIFTIAGKAAHIETTATAIPTVTAGCGTAPVIQAGATDNAFRINVGTGGTATTCTVTFQKAFTNIPACIAGVESGTVFNMTVAPTVSTVVITASSAWAASTIVGVQCNI